jgi:hypothetical protein
MVSLLKWGVGFLGSDIWCECIVHFDLLLYGIMLTIIVDLLYSDKASSGFIFDLD